MSDIAKVNNALPIKSMDDLFKIGELLAQSGMFGIPNAAAGMVVAATCHQQGITLLDYQRTYHTIDNKPSMKADAMAAELRKRGGRYTIVSRTPELAKAEFSFEGNTVPFDFSMEHAKEAGYPFKGDGKTIKDNWRKTPENMLWARMMSNAVRVLCPEICAGLYTPEELWDSSDTVESAPSQKPVPIDQNKVADAVAKVNKTTTKAAQIEDAEEVKDLKASPMPDFNQGQCINPDICPVPGPKFNVKWADMDAQTLTFALKMTNPEMTKEHMKAVAAQLAIKEGK